MHTKGIYYDSLRAIPTFFLVMTISALYSAPDTRAEAFTFMKSLSRMASVHLLLIEPINKFISIYVIIICVEKQQTTNVTVSLIVAQGLKSIRDTHILYCTPHFSRHYLRIDGETEVTVRGNEKNKSLPFYLSCSVFRTPKSARSF